MLKRGNTVNFRLLQRLHKKSKEHFEEDAYTRSAQHCRLLLCNKKGDVSTPVEANPMTQFIYSKSSTGMISSAIVTIKIKMDFY